MYLTSTHFRRLAAAVAAPAALLVAFTACGGGDGGRPSTDEIADSMTSGGFADMMGEDADKINDEAAQCIAEELEKSKVSDETLQAFVDGDEDYDPGKAEEDVFTEALGDVQKACADVLPE